MGMNIDAFEKEISRKETYVRTKIKNHVKKVAEETFETVLRLSPYISGSFIASTKLSVGAMDGGFALFPPGIISRGEAERVAKIQLANLVNFKLAEHSHIFITNSIFYAESVEGGWAFDSGASAPGYLPFARTEQIMKAKT